MERRSKSQGLDQTPVFRTPIEEMPPSMDIAPVTRALNQHLKIHQEIELEIVRATLDTFREKYYEKRGFTNQERYTEKKLKELTEDQKEKVKELNETAYQEFKEAGYHIPPSWKIIGKDKSKKQEKEAVRLRIGNDIQLSKLLQFLERYFNKECYLRERYTDDQVNALKEYIERLYKEGQIPISEIKGFDPQYIYNRATVIAGKFRTTL